MAFEPPWRIPTRSYGNNGQINGQIGTFSTSDIDRVVRKLLGRPLEYTNTGYPAVHRGFGQLVYSSNRYFFRENFGSWVTDGLSGGGLEWDGSIGMEEAAIYWNISDDQITNAAASAPTGLDITDILYILGTGALFGKEQLLYGSLVCRMNFGNYADDWSVNTSNPTRLTGAQNTAAAGFNGSSQYLSVTDNAVHDLDTGDFTIELTFNPRTVGAMTLLSKYADASNFWEVTYTSGEVIQFNGATTAGGTLITITGTTVLWENRDYHIVIACDRSAASTTVMYLDGVDDTSGTPTVSTSTIANSGAFEIGRKGAASQHWDGRIRHVRIWKSLLTQANVTTLYNGGVGTYDYASMIAATDSPGAAIVAYDLAADANDEVGSVNLTNNGTTTFGGTLATDDPAVADDHVDVEDPYLFSPIDFFGVDLPRWAVFNDGANIAEAMQVDAAGAKATATIEFYGNPSDADTITICSKTYTFESGTVDTEGEVLIGADARATAKNLYLAIIGGPSSTGGTTLYQAAAAHPVVAALMSNNPSVGGVESNVITLTAKHPGTRGNSFTFSESATNVLITAFAGGTDKVTLTVPHQRDILYFDNGTGTNPVEPANDDTVTIDQRVYTFKTTLTGAADEVLIGTLQVGSGTHDGCANDTDLTDSSETFITDGVRVGDRIYNTADSSLAVITDLTETTITGTLAAGTDNDWDVGDTFVIHRIALVRDNLIAAINRGDGEGTTYGTGTLAHPRVWAYPGPNDGGARTMVAEMRDTTSLVLTIDENMTAASWLDRGAAGCGTEGGLNRLVQWNASNLTNVDVRDYPYKSFGFGNVVDPNCCAFQIRDGRFEVLVRRQGIEKRVALDSERDKYLASALDPFGTRNWIVKWTSHNATFAATSSHTQPATTTASQGTPEILAFTSLNLDGPGPDPVVPNWPLEVDIINYYIFDSTIGVPWLEYYSYDEETMDQVIDSYSEYSLRTTDVQVQGPAPGLIYRGFSVKEAASPASTAEFNIRHGDNDNEHRLENINLVADESGGIPRNTQAPRGIFLEVVSGTIDITIYWAKQPL